ncbi:MAG: class I tRNA ligase family protein, partial [Thermodesulfobacteriota bacterium]
AAFNKVAENMKELAFNKALSDIWEFISSVNKYVDDNAPWTLSKEGNTERLGTVLYTVAESIRLISLMLSPFIPQTSQIIWEKLGFKDQLSDAEFEKLKDWGLLEVNTKVSKGQNLFQRIVGN